MAFLFLSFLFLYSESSHLNAVYRLSLLVGGPPSPPCCCLFVLCSFVSWAASPHKASLSFGGGRVELLVWVALFRPRCCFSSLVFVFRVFSCCLLFSFPLLCSLSEFWICGVSSSDLACVLLLPFPCTMGSLFRMSFFHIVVWIICCMPVGPVGLGR